MSASGDQIIWDLGQMNRLKDEGDNSHRSVTAHLNAWQSTHQQLVGSLWPQGGGQELYTAKANQHHGHGEEILAALKKMNEAHGNAITSAQQAMSTVSGIWG